MGANGKPVRNWRRLALFLTAGVFLVFGILSLRRQNYMQSVGAAALAFVYAWLGTKNTREIAAPLEESLSELSSALPDIQDFNSSNQ